MNCIRLATLYLKHVQMQLGEIELGLLMVSSLFFFGPSKENQSFGSSKNPTVSNSAAKFSLINFNAKEENPPNNSRIILAKQRDQNHSLRTTCRKSSPGLL